MVKKQLDALREASQQDEELAAALSAAATTEEWVRVANERGFAIAIEDVQVDDEDLSDAELEGAAGGYTFPQTDWIYCDNPWTNVYCTLKC